ncbi:MAG: MATE family efflux transporter [Kordiimonadaceae bacterium]|nr:MATE family efflux transporter [Kordiimonadaceae bacterium]
MVGGIAATMAFNIVDTYFIGQLGVPELAAMGFVNPVVMTIVSASVGMSMGTSSVLSRALGKGDPTFIRNIASNSILLSLLLSIALTIIGLTFNDQLFRMLGANKADLERIWQYMQIWWPGIFLIIVPMVSLGQIRAMGRTGLQSRIMIYASIINAILDPILIMGFYMIPALGLKGAAIATILTRLMTLISAFYYLKFEFDLLDYSKNILGHFFDNSKTLLHVALPATCTNLITPFAIGVITAMVATYGTNAVAAFNIANNVEAICRITFFAAAAAIAPFMGQNMGAEKFKRMKIAVRYCAYFCISWGLFLALVIALVGEMMARFFNDTPEVVEIATLYMYIVPISYGFFGLVRNITSGLNAMGRPLPGTSISFVRAIILQVPLAIYGGANWGLAGIFGAICLSNIVASILAFFWNRRILSRL